MLIYDTSKGVRGRIYSIYNVRLMSCRWKRCRDTLPSKEPEKLKATALNSEKPLGHIFALSRSVCVIAWYDML